MRYILLTSHVVWLQTDPSARFRLGYDAVTNPPSCEVLCDVVNFGTARDVDGSTSGIVGSTMVSAQLPELTTGSGQCTYDRNTASYVCDKNYNLVPMALSTARRIGPVAITRDGRSYGSKGPTGEGCAGTPPPSRYPFTALLGSDRATVVNPKVPMSSSGGIEWFAKPNDVIVLELMFKQGHEHLHLYIDGKDQAANKVSRSEMPVTVNSKAGTWSYSPQDKKMTFVMHGRFHSYKWAPRAPPRPAAAIRLAVLIDIPPSAPAGFKAAVVEKYTYSVVSAISFRLRIPAHRFKVVCVHPKGQPCLKGRARRGNVDAAATADSASTEYDFEYEVTMPNEDNGFDNNGTKLPSYTENLEFAKSVTAEIEQVVANGEVVELINNATRLANITEINITTTEVAVSSEDAGVKFVGLPTGDGGAIALLTSTSGSVYHDVDFNAVNNDGDRPVEGAVVNIRKSGSDTIIGSSKSDESGRWTVAMLQPDTAYTASVVMPVVVASVDGTYFWKHPHSGSPVEFASSVSSEVIVDLACEQWTAAAGYVGEGSNADSNHVGIFNVSLDVTSRGYSGRSITGLDGKWVANVPFGGAWSVAVDKTTLPFPQPYNGAAVVGNDRYSSKGSGTAGAGLVVVFPRYGIVGGELREEFRELNAFGNETITRVNPLAGASVLVTDSTGRKWNVETDEHGKWQSSVPYGTTSAAFNSALSSPDCLRSGNGEFTPAVDVGSSAGDEIVDFGVEMYDCVNHCSEISCSGEHPICVDAVHGVACKSTTITSTTTITDTASTTTTTTDTASTTTTTTATGTTTTTNVAIDATSNASNSTVIGGVVGALLLSAVLIAGLMYYTKVGQAENKNVVLRSESPQPSTGSTGSVVEEIVHGVDETAIDMMPPERMAPRSFLSSAANGLSDARRPSQLSTDVAAVRSGRDAMENAVTRRNSVDKSHMFKLANPLRLVNDRSQDRQGVPAVGELTDNDHGFNF